MKHLLWIIPAAIVASALFMGRRDIQRLRTMSRMSHG
jgi:hypothetical protein